MLSGPLTDAYFKGHEHFYENRRRLRDVREAVEGVEEIIPILEQLAEEPPRPFTIKSNSQLRRLRVLTGSNDLKLGDASPVGFSLKHGYNRGQAEERVVRENAWSYVPTLQDIIRGLMRTLLEDYPDLLTDKDLRNLQDEDFCKRTMGLRGSGVPVLRPIELGPKVSGHNRYWTKPYSGKYYVTKEWWTKYHSHNAASFLRWVEQLIYQNPTHLGSNALKRHSDELRLYLEA